MITAENKTKRQKNGNIHHYVYYRCTKKSKTQKCSEKSLRSEQLDKQLSSLIKSVSLPADWVEELNRIALEEHKTSAQSAARLVKEKEERLQTIAIKLERLLNGYLDQIIDEQDYRAQKAKLLSEKKSLQEEISSLSRNAHDWLAPLLDWLKDASDLDKIASDTDLFAKKVWAKEIFGSHLRLGGKVVTVAASVAPQNGAVATPTQWAARSAAHASVGFEPTSSILVPGVGIEPTRPEGHEILSLACLPISPSRLTVRPGRESNPRMSVLQTEALPLRHQAIWILYQRSGSGAAAVCRN